jgi:hypothetical protein
MKRFILLCIVVLAACAPSVITVEAGYLVKETKGAAIIVGSSEPISRWQPPEACAYQDSGIGYHRAIRCPTPVEVKVFTAGKITVFVVGESGLPQSLPN